MYERPQILTVSLLFDFNLFIKQHFYRNDSVLNALIHISCWSATYSYNHLQCSLCLVSWLNAIFLNFLSFHVNKVPKAVYRTIVFQEKWKIMCQQWAITCWVDPYTYCVAGAQSGPLFVCSSCTSLFHQPSPYFQYFHQFFLSKLCLVWVLACRLCPAPLHPTPLPPPVSVAWLTSRSSLLTSGAAGMPDGPIHQTWGRGLGGGGGLTGKAQFASGAFIGIVIK